ncbi:Zinc finger protein 12 [Chionoecetes opilio]|uniref:Zinc finger protein 12 n=1 Tax=Chionoecetes opilio TaxID=41210 RepID=A0A8J4Y345_CHIOP|nr:Zinc finger protein 12 [Chionoecetes opilio]
MADLSHGQPTEFNDFRSQLNGLLATLEKLPVGEKQTALDLLKVTVKDQLGDSDPVQDKQNQSEPEKYFYQDGSSHCPVQEEVRQESESEFDQHPSVVNEGQEVDEDLCLNHEVPQSQGHPQDSHLKHAMGENLSFNILHHLSDTECLENSLSVAVAKNDKEGPHKDSRSRKEEDSNRRMIISELKTSINADHDSQSTCCLKDNPVLHRKEDGTLIQIVSESQKNIFDRSALYSLHNDLKDDENQQHTLGSLEKYSEVLHVSEQDRLLGHAHEHAAVSLLTHNEQQLTLIASREFCESSQEVSELRTILDAEDHHRNLSVLEEQNGHSSQDYASGEPLLQLRIITGKQDGNEVRLESCDKDNILNENSCNSINLSHFHHISDRDNLYSEENSYLLPYLERDNYEKIGYKIESIVKKSDQEGLERSLEASYSSDNLEGNERGEAEQDKTPVDLSSTSGNVQNIKTDGCLTDLEESLSDPQQPSCSDSARHTWNRGQAKRSQTQQGHRQKRVRSENKRHKNAKHDKTLSSKEDRSVERTDSCGVHESNATEDQHTSKPSLHNMTLKETTSHGKGNDNQCHNFEAAVPTNDISDDLADKKNSTKCNSETLGTDVQDEPHYHKETDSSQNIGDEIQSSNMMPVSCRNCKKELPDILVFLVHQRQCEGHFSCPICFVKFVHKITHSRHMEGHKRNVCSECSQSFCSHKKLKAHMKAEHNFELNSKSYPCNRCSRTFLKRSSLYYHLNVHAEDEEQVCQKCGAFCKGKDTFNLHMADHIKATKFHCHICSASFKRRQQYDDHLRHHKQNKCEICGQPFTTKKALIRHCRHEHDTLPQNITVDREYKCDKCERVFNRPSLLRYHLQLHRGVKLECRLCNKQFSHKRGLRKHMNSIVHEHSLLTNNLQKDHAYDVKESYAYTCEYCGIKLPSKHLLSTHNRLTHEVGITWHCPHCDYTTKRNHTLKRHIQLHMESRNFMCEICGSSFQALATLKDHYNFVHSDERNYKCSECDKSFKNKSSLARHSRTHSDDRPYKCHCGTTYKRLSHLKRHTSSAHKETMKSRAVKKLRRSEDRDTDLTFVLSDAGNGQELNCSKDFSESEEFEFVPVTSCSLSPVIQADASVKGASDILLPAQESIILMGENSDSEQGHLITVGDSQIIQLIPSTFQFPQDTSFQTVSLVSAGDLQAIPLSASSSYSQGPSGPVVVEPFSLSHSSETMVMVPATHHLAETGTIPTGLHILDNEALAESARIGREPINHGIKQEITLSTLEGHTELPVSPDLDTYSYSGAASSPQNGNLLPALPPPHFITHAHSHTASQDMLQPSLICADFVLPVEVNT